MNKELSLNMSLLFSHRNIFLFLHSHPQVTAILTNASSYKTYPLSCRNHCLQQFPKSSLFFFLILDSYRENHPPLSIPIKETLDSFLSATIQSPLPLKDQLTLLYPLPNPIVTHNSNITHTLSNSHIVFSP